MKNPLQAEVLSSINYHIMQVFVVECVPSFNVHIYLCCAAKMFNMLKSL